MGKNLVVLTHNEPMTTSLVIANGTKNQHHAVIQLVRTYQSDLEEFGIIAFEMRKSRRGRPTEYAILNEPQSPANHHADGTIAASVNAK